ncbi:hypothetical protein K443DRAFT_126728, partial [Laccaria amethystina LaAM-08-1]
MAWLNCSLIQYSSEKRILPDTQVAAQPGVQTRDLMSFLASVKCWATRHKEPVYALKRDQIKGFDYLAPEGFHDAIRSYGLPESIIDIDKAAQKDTKCFIRTAYGVTVPIVVSDVNKQGGPLSPIKSTFMTSLGHYYLNDLMVNDPDALIVSSSARERNNPHLKDDGDCVNICNHRNPQKLANLNGNTLRWVIGRSGEVVILEREQRFDKAWSPAACKNWITLIDAFRDGLTLNLLVNGPLELSIPKRIRESRAENMIRALANVCGFRNLSGMDNLTWASDGLMKPASATIEDDKVVFGAATGASTLVLKIPGRNISILHGEQVGLIIALILAGRTSCDAQHLLTDHLNSVRLIEDSRSNVSQISRLRNMNGQSYYRWILSLVERTDINVKYMPAHTDKDTLEARMNRDADFYASSSHDVKHLIPQSPIPTFHMNDYTFYRDGDGWIESNIGDFVDVSLARETSTKLRFGNKHRMATWAHDQSSPPDFPYLRSPSAHLAAVQLYARSGQLPTADILVERGKMSNNRCRLGCDDVEDMHHVFVN